jgi:hypothetical protein
LPFTAVARILMAEYLPAGSGAVPPLIAAGVFGEPRLKGTPPMVWMGASKLAEYARPPPSSPPEVNGRPSVMMPDTVESGDRLTMVLLELPGCTVNAMVAV